MTNTHSTPAASKKDLVPVKLTVGGGGWVILLSGLVCTLLITWAVLPAILRKVDRPMGDGRTVESYGFALAPSRVPLALVTPAMLHRDMVPVMDEPTYVDGARIDGINAEERGKVLVPSDRVIGVVVEDDARAYPVGLLYVHEIINDTLGGRPIAVTHHWPCDSIAVFDRRDGEHVRTLGVSGLVYNSNQLLYDRTENTRRGGDGTPGGESLWSQLLGRAVTGPAAETDTTLTTLPYEVTSWSDWLERHPETTVVMPEPRFAKRYRHAAPTTYLLSDDLLAPVEPAPPADGPAAKSRVVAIEAGDARMVFPVRTVVDRVDDEATWRYRLGETDLVFRHVAEVDDLIVTAEDGTPIDVTHAFWFAWHAMYPEVELFTGSS